jgi:hypothetical protein
MIRTGVGAEAVRGAHGFWRSQVKTQSGRTTYGTALTEWLDTCRPPAEIAQLAGSRGPGRQRSAQTKIVSLAGLSWIVQNTGTGWDSAGHGVAVWPLCLCRSVACLA